MTALGKSRDVSWEWVIERQDDDGEWQRHALAGTSATVVTEQAREAFEWYVREANRPLKPEFHRTFRLVEVETETVVARRVIEEPTQTGR